MNIESPIVTSAIEAISPYLYMTPCKEDYEFSVKVNPFTINHCDQSEIGFSRSLKRPSYISKFEIDPNTTARTRRSRLKATQCSPFTKEPLDFSSRESRIDNTLDKESTLDPLHRTYHLTFLRDISAMQFKTESISLLDIIRKSSLEKSPNGQDSAVKSFICKYCGESFCSGCALGGHISKSHRGLSKIFKNKKLRFCQRKIERERSYYLKDLRMLSDLIGVPSEKNQRESEIDAGKDFAIFGQDKEASN